MKTLEKEIRKNGFDYKLVERNETCAIYEQINNDDGEKYTVAFEVFKIKITKDATICGNQLIGGEVFPGNEDFGKTAFSFGTFGNRENALKKSYKKYEELSLNK